LDQVKEIKVDAKPKQINEAEVKNLFGEFPKKIYAHLIREKMKGLFWVATVGKRVVDTQ
jgi:hypothetical protein